MDARLAALQRLLEIVDRLRAPDGCPWDRKQTLPSMAPHLLEEAYEVVQVLERDDDRETVGELGDLLMNVVLLGRIGEDEGRFSIADIGEQVSNKLIRRHPHVFGDREAHDPEAALSHWEDIKRQERAEAGDQQPASVLAGVPNNLPALLRAFRVGEKAAQVGFDWPDLQGPRDKLDEELSELGHEIEGGSKGRQFAELGDVLFAVVNVARKLGINPEMALRATIDRFQARFQHIERELGPAIADTSLEEMERLWQEAKD